MSVLISRRDSGALARWWYSVDWGVLGAVLLLMLLGIIFSLAASPPVAERIGLDGFHFFRRHLFYLGLALPLFIGMTFLSGRQVRRVALVVLGLGLALMVVALFSGGTIKGARRWVQLGFMSIQPSEFVKPAFVVLAAWLLVQARQAGQAGQALFSGTAEAIMQQRMAALMAWGMYVLIVGLLIKQPDLGQTMLISAVWGGMLYLLGLRWRYILMMGAGLVALLGAAYVLFAHVRARVDRFLNPPELPPGARDQIDFAMDALRNGGLLGAGPGGGRANRYLPDAHTDFLFAAIGEEFGWVALMVILMVVAFVALRLLFRALHLHDPFRRLAVSGLAMLFGLQAFINMGVNVHVLPAKGMTLPFVSYGGSSLLAMALTLGMALALLRQDVERQRSGRATGGVVWSGA